LPPEQLFAPPYLDPSILYLADRTASTDDYTAKQNILGLYWMVDVPLTDKFQFTGGVRVEQCDQKVTSFEPFDPNRQPFEGKFFTTDILPAVTLVYALDSFTKIRLAASQTVSRPDFREMSKFEYQEYDGGYNYIGNPDLQRALVRNFDLRTERLWDGTNLASISLFYKYFVHPIEVANYSSSGKEISYFNADNAYNYGVELELRQSLGYLWHPLRKVSFTGNLTLLQSHVNLNNTIEGLNTLQNRPMQGQSPYLLNLDAGYLDADRGTRCDLLLNVFGRRIQTVGAQDVPTIYELPHPNLDFTFQQRLFTGLDLKGSAENLLDQEYLLQFGVPGQFYQYRYYQGRSYSLGLSYHL
jgi:outer membrane receptor protein involved in Fe transport